MTQAEILENKKTTLTGDLYITCSEKIGVFKVNEYGLPITDDQVELYKLKADEAKKVISGAISVSLNLEAEYTNDTVSNLANIILAKRNTYIEQLGFIEVIRRIISEKITANDLVTAKRYLENFKNANPLLDESGVRAILV